MASLAAMFKHKGFYVYGSDEGVYPPMSTFLQEQEIPVFQGFDPEHLKPAPDLVVVGNVISRGNVEIEEILARHIPYISLPGALAEYFIRGHRSIVVTGTHGKTTTSSLLAWVFDFAGRKPGFMIGGIPQNFGRGFQVGKGEDFIVEGDEYDSAFFDKAAKFLRYLPDIGIINSIEFDHADIYDSIKDIEIAFRRFVNLIPKNGLLVVGQENKLAMEISRAAFCPVESFGLNNQATWFAENIKIGADGTDFDVFHNGTKKVQVKIRLYGNHNIRNSLAVIAVAHHAGIEFETIRKALSEFSGVKRRQELKGDVSGIKIYDDFGHHPTAVHETLQSFRAKFPQKRIWALFEPRTATTRRDVFQQDFADAFAPADKVLIAPVHRPDKAPAGHVFSSEKLADDLHQRNKSAQYFKSINEIVQHLATHAQSGDIIITFSNGPFGNIHQKLLEKFGKRGYNKK